MKAKPKLYVPESPAGKQVVFWGHVFTEVENVNGVQVLERQADPMESMLLGMAAETQEASELTTAQVVNQYKVDRRTIRRLKRQRLITPIDKRRKSNIWARADIERAGIERK